MADKTIGTEFAHAVWPSPLYLCFECFESSFPQSLGGNPEFFVSERQWIPDYYLGNDNHWFHAGSRYGAFALMVYFKTA